VPWNYGKNEMEVKLSEQLKMPKVHICKLKSDIDYLEKQLYFEKINYIILFGSCCKGIATLRSDIDLGIITGEDLTRNELADIRVTLNDDSQFGVETNAVILSQKNYVEQYDKQRLYREIGDGLQIYHKEGRK